MQYQQQNVTVALYYSLTLQYVHEVMLSQRDHGTCSITRNNKSDLPVHSKSVVFVPFDMPYMISYLSFILSMPLSCTIFDILSLISQKFMRSRNPTTPTRVHISFQD